MVAGPVRNRLPSSPTHPQFEPRSDAAAAATNTTVRSPRRQRRQFPRAPVTELDTAMSAANFYIPTLPGLPADSTLSMYGGHIPSLPSTSQVGATSATSSESDAHLYFFMLKARHIADKERTIFWFNGGPGCSSFDGSMMEVGPLRIEPGSKGTLKEIDSAWNEYANVVFVDQPAGTGYSYVSTNKYVHELDEAANHVIEFMTRFYTVFPEFQRHDTYLAGESYAGQYIPYIARAILDSARIKTPLKGVLIGNGWIDPYSQYPAYLDFALQSGVIKKGSAAETAVRQAVKECMTALESHGGKLKVKVHTGACESILQSITDATVTSVNGLDVCVNNYDVRLTDSYPACGMNWPPDLANITPYLQREDVKKAFHASRHDGGWTECNGGVGSNFWASESVPAVQLLPKLLEEIPVLLFAGDQDLICNHLGIERLIEGLTWKGETGFGTETAKNWFVNGKPAGQWTTARGLTYVKIADASHMVPYDQPLASHDMLLRFLDVNLLGAAGSSARVPSKVGDEVEAVVGETKIDGTAVTSGPDGVRLEEGGKSAKTDASDKTNAGAGTGDVDKSAGSGLGLGLGMGAGGTSPAAVEGLVNVGSALVIIIIMMLSLCVFLIVRRRMRRHLHGIGGANGALPALGGRRKSLGRGQSLAERTHEMDNLVVPGAGRHADDDEEQIVGGRGRSASEVFGVGEYDEDEDAEDGKFKD
ncbi:BQ2448_748 [Microbotryum intermedium]|uniref:Carboxypeptidase n=1 Tax=Microbotryum intermedium TaxID=269621 RepID=A0A238F673_9BASI|nr:BQ2448_748 [Microbotryum intermedium]